MVTRAEVLMGRDKSAPLTQQMEENLALLLTALNKFRKAYGKPLIVSSGYRPAAINAMVGGAKASNHMRCLACDFKDVDGAIDAFCLANKALLVECGLFLEDPASTPGWSHMQVVAPKSGNRIFKP